MRKNIIFIAILFMLLFSSNKSQEFYGVYPNRDQIYKNNNVINWDCAIINKNSKDTIFKSKIPLTIIDSLVNGFPLNRYHYIFNNNYFLVENLYINHEPGYNSNIFIYNYELTKDSIHLNSFIDIGWNKMTKLNCTFIQDTLYLYFDSLLYKKYDLKLMKVIN